ncbi:Uncharacterised protein [uncultured archaeon]|nr:Uncharacterised protein [uncultured archaeon]
MLVAGANSNTLIQYPNVTANYTVVVTDSGVTTPFNVSNTITITRAIYPNVTLTFSNNQNVATSTNFQQRVQTNSSPVFQNMSSNGGNVRFYIGQNELYSWLQSKSGSLAVYYVKIPLGIGANSLAMVNMTFLSSLANFDGVYAGRNPTLGSSGYGACSGVMNCDNGANVFAFYDNFKSGETLSAKWNCTSGFNPVPSNGISMYQSATWGCKTWDIYDPSQLTVDWDGHFDTGAAGEQVRWQAPGASPSNYPRYLISSASGAGWGVSGLLYALTLSNTSSASHSYCLTNGNGACSSGFMFINNTANHLFTLKELSSSVSLTADNLAWYNGSASPQSNFAALTQAKLVISAPPSSGTIYTQFLAIRQSSPNGIMPAMSFNPPQAQQLAVSITPVNPTIVNGGNVQLVANPSGGTANYSYLWYSMQGSTSPTCTAANVLAGETASAVYVSPNSTTTYAVKLSDSGSSICSAGDIITVTPAFGILSFTASNSPLIVGQNQTLTGVISNGIAPYTYNFFVYSYSLPQTTPFSVLHTGVNSTTDDFTFNQGTQYTPGDWGATLIVTDAASQTGVTALTYILKSDLQANPIVSAAPTIHQGNSVILNSNVSGGVTPFSINWYSQAGCLGAVRHSGTDYEATPSNTSAYSYNVIDFYGSHNCSASKIITVIPALRSNCILALSWVNLTGAGWVNRYVCTPNEFGVTRITNGQNGQTPADIAAYVVGGIPPYAINWYKNSSPTSQCKGTPVHTGANYSIPNSDLKYVTQTYYTYSVADSDNTLPNNAMNCSGSSIGYAFAPLTATSTPVCRNIHDATTDEYVPPSYPWNCVAPHYNPKIIDNKSQIIFRGESGEINAHLNGGIGPYSDLGGYYSISPSNTTTFTYCASDSDSNSSCAGTVINYVPPLVSINASANSIEQGRSINFNATILNGTANASRYCYWWEARSLTNPSANFSYIVSNSTSYRVIRENLSSSFSMLNNPNICLIPSSWNLGGSGQVKLAAMNNTPAGTYQVRLFLDEFLGENSLVEVNATSNILNFTVSNASTSPLLSSEISGTFDLATGNVIVAANAINGAPPYTYRYGINLLNLTPIMGEAHPQLGGTENAFDTLAFHLPSIYAGNVVNATLLINDGNSYLASNWILISTNTTTITTTTASTTSTTSTSSSTTTIAVYPNLYVTQQSTGNVLIINTTTGSVIGNQNIAYRVADAAFGQSKKSIFFLTRSTGTNFQVKKYNISSASVTDTLNIGAQAARGIVLNPSGTYAFVTNYGNNTVSVISTSGSMLLTRTVPVCQSDNSNASGMGQGAAVTPNGSYLYVTCMNGISKVDLSAWTVNTLYFITTPDGHASWNFAYVNFTPNSAVAYVTAQSGDAGTYYNVLKLGVSNDTPLAAISTNLSEGNNGKPNRIVILRGNAYIGTIGGGNNAVEVMNLTNSTVTGSISLGGLPVGRLTLTPDAQRAYAIGYVNVNWGGLSPNVYALNLNNRSVASTIVTSATYNALDAELSLINP